MSKEKTKNNDNWAPLFIIGSGRCGSTFLTALLNSSQYVYIPYESSFIVKAFPFFNKKKKYSLYDYQLIASLFHMTSTGGWGLSQKKIVEYLCRGKPDSFKKINDVIYENYLKSKNFKYVSHWGIRRPQLIAHINRIIKVYPKAKFIHLVRDGRDVYLSYKNLNKKDKFKFGPSSLIPSIFYWIDIVSRRPKKSSNLLEIRYEDLIQNTENLVSEISKYINLPDLIVSIKNYESKRNEKGCVTDHQLSGINSKVYSGIDKANIFKYKKNLSKIKIIIFELFAGHWLKYYNYEIITGNYLYKLFFPITYAILFIYKYMNNIRYWMREWKYYNRAKKQLEKYNI